MTVTTQKPKYLYLADMLRSQIESGELKVGDRLPSLAKMYQDHGATQSTMQRVYEVMENANLIKRHGGSGVYVADPTKFLNGTIGVIGRQHREEGRTHFAPYLLNGIEKFTASHHQHVMFLDASPNADGLQKVDGLLLLNDENQAHDIQDLPAGLPRISLFHREDDTINVITDDLGGAKKATLYLIKQGHRRIACLMQDQKDVPKLRFMGYQEAMRDVKITVLPEWVRLTKKTITEEKVSGYREWGRKNMHEWLREGWLQTGCTAILVQNDLSAIGVMQVLQEEGIAVPSQVSVMGFDGTELCDNVSPRLCSMKLPFTDIGYKAAEMLYQQIHFDQSEIQTVMLPMSLRPGESVASPR